MLKDHEKALLQSLAVNLSDNARTLWLKARAMAKYRIRLLPVPLGSSWRNEVNRLAHRLLHEAGVNCQLLPNNTLSMGGRFIFWAGSDWRVN